MSATAELELHVYMIDDGERHWYAATGPRDALEQHCALIGDSLRSFLRDYGRPEIVLLRDDALLGVRDLLEPGEPQELKSCREWCSDGKGPIASTCY